MGLVERLLLSPEGYTFDEMRRLTRALYARGVRTFTFSLHSPSVMPGCTAYVSTERDRVSLIEKCRRYFEFFMAELSGVSMVASELRAHLDKTVMGGVV
jgi:hypothetical protein